MNRILFILLFIGTAFVSQPVFAQSDDTVLFDIGYVEDNVYYNDFFEFEFKIPNDWDFKLDKEQKIMKKAIKEVYSDNNELRQYLDPEDIETAILIIINRQYIYGSRFSPNMLIMIENVSGAPMISSGADYLTASARGLKISNPKVKISKEEYGRHDFGRTFYSMDTRSKVGNMKIHQTFYTAIIGDFAFSVLATYQDEEQLAEIYQIMKGFKFRGH